MRYVQARDEEVKRERTYRIYVTDALYCMGQLNIRYSDMISKKVPHETDPDKIKNRIKEKLAKMETERR